MVRATIKDVAALAGVSTATVSNVFSERKHVSPDLVRRVEEAAGSLSYKIDRAASQLRSGRMRVIGVLVPNFTDTFFSSLVSYLEELAAKEDYQVLVVSARDDPEQEAARLDALLGWRPSGVIAVPCTNAIPAELRQKFGSLPMVLADRVGEDNLPVDTVVADNYAAGRDAARHVLEFGHQDIVIAASVASFRPIADRIKGIVETCREANGHEPFVVELGPDPEAGARRLSQWLDENPRPTAVIATTNVTTLATLSALAARGWDIPEDVSLVGFDDYTWMTARKVPLSAMRQPIADIASAIWTRLLARMDGDLSGPKQIVLQAPLQIRKSVAKVSV